MGKIKQSNIATTAKYEYTKVQKNVMFLIVRELQPLMTKEELEWKEHTITIQLSALDANNNYKRIKGELTKLRRKDIEFVFQRNGEPAAEVVTGLISSFKHVPNSKEVTIYIPSAVLPFLCSIGRGYTELQTIVALSLRSTHSQRMYELCHRWKNHRGAGFSYPISELKAMLGVESKYKQIGELKKKVLNVAHKELKEKADVWFDYTLEKRHSRSYNWIVVKIHQNSPEAIKDNRKGEKGDKYSFVWRFLQHSFSSNQSDKANVITDQIANNGDLDTAYDRFARLDDELTTGKKERLDIIRITKYFLKEDLNIKY